MNKVIYISRDVVAALIINTKNLCGQFPYTSIKECIFFEKELNDRFLEKGINSHFSKTIDKFLFSVSDNGFITPCNNYDSALINFLNSSTLESKTILNDTSIILNILIKCMDKEKIEVCMFTRQLENFTESQKTR